MKLKSLLFLLVLCTLCSCKVQLPSPTLDVTSIDYYSVSKDTGVMFTEDALPDRDYIGVGHIEVKASPGIRNSSMVGGEYYGLDIQEGLRAAAEQAKAMGANAITRLVIKPELVHNRPGYTISGMAVKITKKK